MNAIDYLVNEHRLQRERLDQIETDKEAFAVFKEEFIQYVNKVETIFYVNLLKIPDLKSTIHLSWEEHSICKQLFQEMDTTDINSTAWSAKFSILKKMLLSHLDDVEDILFPQIKAVVSDDQLQEIGDQLLAQEMFNEADDIINLHQ